MISASGEITQNQWPLLLAGNQCQRTHQMSELEIGLALNKSMAGNHMMTSTAQDHGHCQVLGTQQHSDGQPYRLCSDLEALHHNLGGCVWLTWLYPQ